jgi:hypothetical protein
LTAPRGVLIILFFENGLSPSNVSPFNRSIANEKTGDVFDSIKFDKISHLVLGWFPDSYFLIILVVVDLYSPVAN